MSTETKVLTVNRNGIDFPLANTAFGKNQKDYPGLVFPYPEITKENLADFINWAGDKWTISELNRSVRADAGDLVQDFINEEGILDDKGLADYLEALKTFTYTSGRGAGSKSAIEDDRNNLQMLNLEDTTKFMNGEEGLRDVIKARIVQINEMNARIAELDAIYKARADKRAATTAKKEAAKATADLKAAQDKAVQAGVAAATA